MQKRVKRIYKGVAFTHIFLLVLAILALAVSFNELESASGIVIDYQQPSKSRALVGTEVPSSLSLSESKVMIPSAGKTIQLSDGVKLERLEINPDGTGIAHYNNELASRSLSSEEVNELLDTKGLQTAPEYTPYDAIWGQRFSSPLAGNLVQGLTWAVTVAGVMQMVGTIAGLETKQTNAVTISAMAGIISGKAAYGAFSQWGTKGTTWGFGGVGAQWVSAGIGVGIGAAILIATYKTTETVTVKYSCLPWQPPIGGARCEDCNKDPMKRCTEYRCRALGQACQLLNKETPGKETCAWVNPKDVNSPTIRPATEDLSPEGLKYIEDTSIRPPALGVKVVREGSNECLQAFTPLVFGLTTNEPAQCKIDFNHTLKFDDMQFFVGESNLFGYNHTQIMRLPGPNASSGSPVLKNDGTMQFFVRCKDANGNENADEYSVKFCVDKSPDTTVPKVEGTSIPTGGAVQFGADSTPIELYLNEPAECKWSVLKNDSYDSMPNTMSCAMDASQVNAMLSYTCTGNLTGIKDKTENKYYFRCRDQPGEDESKRNTNTQSYELVLRGSQPLNIIGVKPNGTVSGSTESVNADLEVETSNGADSGKAWCSFSSNNADNSSYVLMAETNDYKHKQTLQLVSGDYTYYFRCVDSGGNMDNSQTSFTVYSDKEAPKVTRVYKEESTGLKVVTNEDAECVYSLTGCNFAFGDGLKMSYISPSLKKSSYAEWKPNTIYYVKCADAYGNEPNPNECSVIAGAI